MPKYKWRKHKKIKVSFNPPGYSIRSVMSATFVLEPGETFTMPRNGNLQSVYADGLGGASGTVYVDDTALMQIYTHQHYELSLPIEEGQVITSDIPIRVMYDYIYETEEAPVLQGNSLSNIIIDEYDAVASNEMFITLDGAGSGGTWQVTNIGTPTADASISADMIDAMRYQMEEGFGRA